MRRAGIGRTRHGGSLAFCAGFIDVPDSRANLRRVSAAWSAHRALRVQLRGKGPLRLPAQVLNDLTHEVAAHVAANVRHAALRRLRQECASRLSA